MTYPGEGLHHLNLSCSRLEEDPGLSPSELHVSRVADGDQYYEENKDIFASYCPSCVQ